MGFWEDLANSIKNFASKAGSLSGNAFVPYQSQGIRTTALKASGVTYLKADGSYATPTKKQQTLALKELIEAPAIMAGATMFPIAAQEMGTGVLLGEVLKDMAVATAANEGVKYITDGDVNSIGEAVRNLVENTTGFEGFDDNTLLGSLGNDAYEFGSEMLTPGYSLLARTTLLRKPSNSWALRMIDALNNEALQVNFLAKDLMGKSLREGETFPVYRIEGVKYPEEWGIKAASKARDSRRSYSSTYNKSDSYPTERTAKYATDNKESLGHYFADRIMNDFNSNYNTNLKTSDIEKFLSTGKLPKGIEKDSDVALKLNYIRDNYDELYNNSIITELLYKSAGTGVTPLEGTVTIDGVTAPIGFNYNYLPIVNTGNGYKYNIKLSDLVYDKKLGHFIPKLKGNLQSPMNTREYTNTDGLAASMGWLDVSGRITPTRKNLSDVPLITTTELLKSAINSNLPVGRFSKDWFSIPNVNDGYGSFGTTYIIPE